MPEIVRDCGCKGCRTCLICETNFDVKKSNCISVNDTTNTYVYCPLCDKAWPGTNLYIYLEHPKHLGKSIEFPGVFIELNFLDVEEEAALMKGIDEIPWELSQSGRRKQNFGPKTNFKKKKLRIGNFNGFPAFSEFVQRKIIKRPILKDFQTIEQCSLEYDPSRGASIDPHIDDCWVWGERVVTVNCLSDTVLTMSKYKGNDSKYNLNLVPSYKSNIEKVNEDLPEDVLIYLPMPRRSLIVLYGQARYNWEHSILRQHIMKRRVCVAYREFTPLYLKNGSQEAQGKDVLEKSKNFWNHLVTSDKNI